MNIVNFIGIFVGIAGIVIAIMTYFASTKKKLPRYAIRSANLVEGSVTRIKSLEMLYGGQKIENLTATRIALWNAGRETIQGSDIARADPLRITSEADMKILSAEVMEQKNPANQFSVSVSGDQNCAELSFDYLDKNEGAVLQLLHSGTRWSKIEVQGRIKGAGCPERIESARRESAYGLASREMMIALCLNGLVVMAVLCARVVMGDFALMEFLGTERIEQIEDIELIGGLAKSVFDAFIPVISVLALSPLFAFIALSSFPSKARLPKGMEVFEQRFQT